MTPAQCMARDWQSSGSLADCSTASHSALASCKDHAFCRDRAEPQMTFPSCQQLPTTQLPMSVKLAAIKLLQCGRYMQRHSVRVFFIGYGRSRRESHSAPSWALRRSEKKAKGDTLLWKAVFEFSAAAVSAGSGECKSSAVCSGMPCMTLQMTPGMTPYSTDVFELLSS